MQMLTILYFRCFLLPCVFLIQVSFSVCEFCVLYPFCAFYRRRPLGLRSFYRLLKAARDVLKRHGPAPGTKWMGEVLLEGRGTVNGNARVIPSSMWSKSWTQTFQVKTIRYLLGDAPRCGGYVMYDFWRGFNWIFLHPCLGKQKVKNHYIYFHHCMKRPYQFKCKKTQNCNINTYNRYHITIPSRRDRFIRRCRSLGRSFLWEFFPPTKPGDLRPANCEAVDFNLGTRWDQCLGEGWSVEVEGSVRGRRPGELT